MSLPTGGLDHIFSCSAMLQINDLGHTAQQYSLQGYSTHQQVDQWHLHYLSLI